MSRRIALLLAGTMLAGCTVNSGVNTTPTFSQANLVPASPAPLTTRKRADPQRAPTSASVVEAIRGAVIKPTPAEMDGGTWTIKNPSPNRTYEIWTRNGATTTLLLPPGAKFNSAMGGDVESFLLNTSYAGMQPAVTILPRKRGARSNFQVTTTLGFFGFNLVPTATPLTLVDMGEKHEADANGQIRLGVAMGNEPQQVGERTVLALLPPERKSMPAWAPADAWADSQKLVIRFYGPLPVMPALFAGMKGEQMISYRTIMVGEAPYIITDRRVTEAELRVDSEIVRITAAPEGVTVDPNAGADGWRQTQALPEPRAPAPQNNVAVFVMPNGTATTGTLPADTFGTSGTQLFPTDVASPPPPVPARQPMANGLIGQQL